MVALSSGKGSDISSVRSGTVHAARNAAATATTTATAAAAYYYYYYYYYLLPPAVEMIELATGFALTPAAWTVAVRKVANATGMKGWSRRCA